MLSCCIGKDHSPENVDHLDHKLCFRGQQQSLALFTKKQNDFRAREIKCVCCVCKTEQPSTFRFTHQTLQVTDYTHSLTVAELGTAAWTDANAPCPCAFWILKRISSTISIVDGSGDAWLWLMAFAALFLHLEVSVPCNAHAHRKKMASTQNKRQPTGQLNDSTKLSAEGGGKKQKWDVEHKQTTKSILCPRFVLFLCCSVVV